MLENDGINARHWLMFAVASAALLLPALPMASDTPLFFERIDTTPPELLEAEPLEYSTKLRAMGTEGWVVVQFTVLPDGSTADIRVTERSLEGAFDEPAMANIRTATFRPAMRDGRPVEVEMQSFYTFALENYKNRVHGGFQRRAAAASRYLARGDLENAWKRIETLDGKSVKTLAEGCYRDLLKSMYYEQKGDREQALRYAENALMVSRAAVDRASHEALLRRAIVLRAETGQLISSLTGHAELVALGGELAADDPVQQLAEQVQATVNGGDELATAAELRACTTCNPAYGGYRWRHQLARKQFRFELPVEGSMMARLWCDGMIARFLAESGNTFRLPAEVQSCELSVIAFEPAEFRLLELPGSVFDPRSGL